MICAMQRSRVTPAQPGPDSGRLPSWWQGGVIYQVYLRSFQDSNGDGIGDLRGLLSRLPYIASLGVDGLWICPFFPSPMRDFGYDVSDFCGVDPQFGSLDDFDRVVHRAHALGLRVIIDQVWSHTAAEHPWFAQSRSDRTNPKADWYVWAQPKPDGSPPNNWLSWMGGPAWQWEPRRRQYYLHNFLPAMPDLNFHNPDVQDAILQVARFWLDRGVDGFRLDTANLYAHDPQLRDNGALPPESRGDSPVLMQDHAYTMNQPESLAFLQRLRALMDTYTDRMTVGEIGGSQALSTMQTYTRGVDALHTAYSFAFLGGRPDAAAVAEQLRPWSEDAGWPSWAFSNHDAPRVATRWSGQTQQAFSFGGQTLAGSTPGANPLTWMALLLALRGTVFIYQGEELGLPQSEVPFEAMRDPYGLANWPLIPGRDGCRTPMPWVCGAPYAGFSEHAPWLPADPAHAALAVEQQDADPDSMLNQTRALITLRNEHPALRVGTCEVLVAEGDVLFIKRALGRHTVLAAFNLGHTPQAWPPEMQVGTHELLWSTPRHLESRQVLPAGCALFLNVYPLDSNP